MEAATLTQEAIRRNEVQDFLNCEQYADYRLDGWRPIGVNAKMDIGSCVHWMIEQIIKRPERLERYDTLFRWYVTRYRHYHPEVDITEVINGFSAAYHLVPEYFSMYGADLDSKQWATFEDDIQVVWNGHLIEGRPDRIMRKDDGTYWVFDTKTKGQFVLDNLRRQLQFDFQMHWYALLCRESGIARPKGVIYDIVRRPLLRKRAKENEDEFRERIAEDIRGRPEHYFQRLEVKWEPGQVKRFEAELAPALREYSDFRQGFIAKHQPPRRNTAACASRGLCPFLDACSTGNMLGYTQQQERRIK